MLELKQKLEVLTDQSSVLKRRYCEKTIVGLSLAIQLNQTSILPAQYWNEPITCGTNRDFRQQSSEVICWVCAVERGIVLGTEQQYTESIESVIEAKRP